MKLFNLKYGKDWSVSQRAWGANADVQDTKEAGKDIVMRSKSAS